jgi:hypothetical protein
MILHDFWFDKCVLSYKSQNKQIPSKLYAESMKVHSLTEHTTITKYGSSQDLINFAMSRNLSTIQNVVPWRYWSYPFPTSPDTTPGSSSCHPLVSAFASQTQHIGACKQFSVSTPATRYNISKSASFLFLLCMSISLCLKTLTCYFSEVT